MCQGPGGESGDPGGDCRRGGAVLVAGGAGAVRAGGVYYDRHDACGQSAGGALPAAPAFGGGVDAAAEFAVAGGGGHSPWCLGGPSGQQRRVLSAALRGRRGQWAGGFAVGAGGAWQAGSHRRLRQQHGHERSRIADGPGQCSDQHSQPGRSGVHLCGVSAVWQQRRRPGQRSMGRGRTPDQAVHYHQGAHVGDYGHSHGVDSLPAGRGPGDRLWPAGVSVEFHSVAGVDHRHAATVADCAAGHAYDAVDDGPGHPRTGRGAVHGGQHYRAQTHGAGPRPPSHYRPDGPDFLGHFVGPYRHDPLRAHHRRHQNHSRTSRIDPVCGKHSRRAGRPPRRQGPAPERLTARRRGKILSKKMRFCLETALRRAYELNREKRCEIQQAPHKFWEGLSGLSQVAGRAARRMRAACFLRRVSKGDAWRPRDFSAKS